MPRALFRALWLINRLSINEFVANEILEKRDLGEAIRSVSDLLKTIHGMESDASRLKQAIGQLTKVSHVGETYIHRWIDLNVWQYIQARHQYLIDQQTYLDARKTRRHCMMSNRPICRNETFWKLANNNWN